MRTTSAEGPAANAFGKWMALLAALLGWMFDGLEMGLFPLVAKPALGELLGDDSPERVGFWLSGVTAAFLIGAATGGVLFGWLGDRWGRVRAMMASVLVYALFTGACAFAQSPEQLAAIRFGAALGMGGEWALGVALVMEVWQVQSRGLLAGLIGAAANVGYLLIAFVGLQLTPVLGSLHDGLLDLGVSTAWAETLTAHSGWRLLMLIGATPALLTAFIRVFVPESEQWLRDQGQGLVSHWSSRDLLAVGLGALGPGLIVYLWATERSLVVQVVGIVVGLAVALAGYMYPVLRFVQRGDAVGNGTAIARETITRMLIGALLASIALLGTWGAIQFAPSWAAQLTADQDTQAQGAARAWTQIWSSCGAVVGTILGALAGDWLGRRRTYSLLCALSLVASLTFYQFNDAYTSRFLGMMFLAGMCTASFYGWLPLYLPELFRTRVRATGQGFCFNFGRIIAAVGALQTGSLMGKQWSYSDACSAISLIYVVGMFVVWLAPETHGRPLPD
ncbi:MAG: MFS transporter [Pirellulales bacterium]|nr:MFS transporter [Pirellulales bacterium]